MSYRAQIAKVCDRCGALMEATKLQAVPSEQRQPMLELVLQTELTGSTEVRSVHWIDLCPKCKGRVLDLAKALTLDKSLDLPDAEIDTSVNSLTGETAPAPAPAGQAGLPI